jgi:hypothetical protein
VATWESNLPACLIVKIEANKGEPLLNALRQHSENLDIEMTEEADEVKLTED